MKRIAILTATRAEYGLLRNLILKMQELDTVETKVLVTGAHLSEAYGMTYKELEADGVEIYKSIPILGNEEGIGEITSAMSIATKEFGKLLAQEKFDFLVVLGDRYETFAVCAAALATNTPIAHICGGDTTEGAIDEAIRHCITKMSYLHFTSTEIAKNRVIQLGEQPERVFCVGAPGVENALTTELLTKEDLEKELGFILDKPYAVVTFHPVTLEGSVETQLEEVLDALDAWDMKYIITKANADNGGMVINERLEQYAKQRENVYLTSSLGMKRYLSAVKYAEMVIGNSSSGLMEVPSMGVPTINIGNRQRGRVQGNSVLNCATDKEKICEAMRKAQTEEMRNICSKKQNPYGSGNTSEKIVKFLLEYLEKDIDLKKRFYDIPNEE